MSPPGVGAVVLAAGGASRFAASARLTATAAGTASRFAASARLTAAAAAATATATTAGAGAGSTGPAGAPAHKLLAAFRGRPLVRWALEAALEAGLDRTWVVTGAVELGDAVPSGVEVLHNPGWASGQASSLQVAVQAAGEAGLVAVVVGLGDQPMVPPGAWRAVADGPGPIVVASYAGRRRNPVRLDREVWLELAAGGDEGARTLMRHRPELVREVACAGDPADIDTLEDLHRWN